MTAEFTESSLLHPFRHGFFSRNGGCSKGVYAGLNCGERSGDDPDSVRRNRRLVAEQLGVGPQRLISGRQTHSARVAVITEAPPSETPRADGFVTRTPGVALAVLSADCMPILFADSAAGVVGAAHAGWRGALAGVIEETVAGMVRLGSRRGQIRAAVGPAISRENYQVGPEFRHEFLRKDPASEPFFGCDTAGRLVFDLPRYGLSLLARARIREAHWIGRCTYADPTRYFSYRRGRHNSETGTGLLAAAIAAQRMSSEPGPSAFGDELEALNTRFQAG